ncbi:uncharacterized protein CEXT_404092, partial [Caerostris extrusa]
MEDSECQNGGTCISKGDNKFCKCKEGVIGDKCEDIVDCSTGIYKDCIGKNGKCTYNVKELKAECTCTDDKKLHDVEHICKVCEICGERQTCYFEEGEERCKCKEGYADDKGTCKQVCMEDSECQNGGTCISKGDNKFCKCKEGVIGDKCEDIVDCSTGIYKDCIGENGKCTYNVKELKAECTCTDDKKLHDVEHICKECDCGTEGQCKFEEGSKKCQCKSGFADNKGTCEKCDCGTEGQCKFEEGSKKCQCKSGFADNMGTCEKCECGEKGKCSFENGAKNCQCDTGFSEDQGTCRACDCGINGQCSFVNGAKTCRCDTGFLEDQGTCKVKRITEEQLLKKLVYPFSIQIDKFFKFLLQSVTVVERENVVSKMVQKKCECDAGFSEDQETCRACNCGSNGQCSFVNGAKKCECDAGFLEDQGTCKECNCGEKGKCSFENGAKKCQCESGFLEDQGTCKACDCGSNGQCSFVNGAKKCECDAGFLEDQGTCKEDYTTSTVTTTQEVTSEKKLRLWKILSLLLCGYNGSQTLPMPLWICANEWL